MGQSYGLRFGLSMILAILLLFGLGVPAAAQESTSTLKQIREQYVDARDGSQIAEETTYSEEHQEHRPQSLKGYTYVDYERRVEQVYSHKDINYIIGYPDGTVRTGRELTRAEAIVIFYRLYDGVYPDFIKRMSGKTFADVKGSAWYYKELETLYNIGILEGIFEDRFLPDQPITRAELAAVAAKFSDLSYRSGEVFSDVPRDHWAYSYILSATHKGWLKGYEDGTFRPDENITRIETMTLINRVINRSVTKETLEKLKVKNPYSDLPESFWGYCDVMEATVKHNGAQWHGTDYNGGQFNVITERFVDTHGEEIAEPVTTKGKAASGAADIPAYDHLGYIDTITYIYSRGTAAPQIRKTVNKTESYVGDVLTYHIYVSNGEKASDAWKNVRVQDKLPAELELQDGSVYLDNKAAEYTVSNEGFFLLIGSIEPGQTLEVTFKAKVRDNAYHKTIHNTALGIGTNGDVADDTYTATDEGVTIAKGDTRPFIEKSSDRKEARVGDRVAYTITFGNRDGATYPVEKVTVSDTLPEGLELVEGSVRADGKSVKYAMDAKTRTLSAEFGDVEKGKTHTLTFTAKVLPSAYGLTLRNTSLLEGDNIEPISAEDSTGVQIADGETAPALSKQADPKKAKVGDTVTYRITAENEASATVSIRAALLHDVIPEGMDFQFGSVTIDGKTSTDYVYDKKTRELIIELGTLSPKQKKEAAFLVKINASAYNRTIENLATMTGSNMDPVQSRDDGVAVADGKASLEIQKTADKKSVKVGDSVTYTVTLQNPSGSEVDVRNSVFTDQIPAELNFSGALTVDGVSALYSYDTQTRELKIDTGNLAPGQKKVIRITGLVHSGAYGKSFKNTAVVRGDNVSPKTASDEGVQVEPGSADGKAGVKTLSKQKAKVGEVLTYSISLSNASTATADWSGASVRDPIPEYLEFAGNVRLNDSATSAYAYDTASKTLTLTPDPIPPGQTRTYAFDVKVSEGAQGQLITNTAVLEDGKGNTEPIPSQTLEVEEGQAVPSVSKSADKKEVRPGEFIHYTVTASNRSGATAAWKNVSLTDVLPEGTILANHLTVDGEVRVYSLNNDAVDVKLGDIVPGGSVTVEYDVRVQESAAGTTLRNVALLKGENGEKTATDRSVTVIDPEKEDPKEPEAENGKPKHQVEKMGDKTLVNLDASEDSRMVTYTVKVSNHSAEETWKNVTFRDALDTGKVILMDESLYLNSRNLSRSGYTLEEGRTLTITLGDLAPGETKIVKYTLRFKNDASAAEEYTNTATAIGENGEAEGSYSVAITGNPLTTEEHLQLFTGTQVSENGPLYFWPSNSDAYKSISTRDVCRTIYRSLTVKARTQLLERVGGQAKLDSLSSYAQKEDKEIQFFLALGAISEDELNRSKLTEDVDYFGYTWTNASGKTTQIYTIVATRDYMGRCLRAVGLDTSKSGKGYSDTSKTNRTSRLTWATELCEILGRDTDPDTNGLPLKQYQDTAELSAKQKQIINEVSNWHLYTLNNRGKETWIMASGNTV